MYRKKIKEVGKQTICPQTTTQKTKG